MIAIERDKRLFALLQEKFPDEIMNGKLNLVQGDILEFNTSEFEPGSLASTASRYRVVANIPYNITGAIIEKFLTARESPESMTLMVQDEVARRIAKDKKQSILSISVHAYSKPKYIKKVSRKYFSPAPRVDSAILHLDDIGRGFFEQNEIDESLFMAMVKRGFAQKRKQLAGNLGISGNLLERIGLKATVRAEELSLYDWKNLYQQIN